MHDLKKQGVEGNYTPARNLHITLIRKVSARKSFQIRVPNLEMAVNKVSLMKSEQRDGKTVYKEL